MRALALEAGIGLGGLSTPPPVRGDRACVEPGLERVSRIEDVRSFGARGVHVTG
jgi:hypothetical protein